MRPSYLSLALAIIFIMAIMDAFETKAKALSEADSWPDLFEILKPIISKPIKGIKKTATHIATDVMDASKL
ncbi:uncharacterized protein [Mycetomoellerius zeteki]|uniref:uncharacterized protein n=1 Tax=Mycetomoellerius zeteki TaxID=64791 RepID=UPI00084E7F27|nr:PREDICTED: uncharacterized protein LOC108724547 [Trachymyrmex zeteki]